MYFKTNNILLLHPGKTAGTSVERLLLLNLKEELLPNRFAELGILNDAKKRRSLSGFKRAIMYGSYLDENINNIYLHHADIGTAKMLIGEEAYRSAKKVATVRNPYNRLLSAYYYNGWHNRMSFEEFVVQKLRQKIKECEKYTVNHFGLQTRFTHVDGVQDVDILLRQESFYESIKDLESFIGMELKFSLSKTQVSKASELYGDDYLSAYTQEMKEIVDDAYALDFELLGY